MFTNRSVNNFDNNIKNDVKKSKIDISPILKDVEQCIQSGLHDRLHIFFNEFDTYEKTHNEVLELTVVKKLITHNNILTNALSRSIVNNNYKNIDEHGEINSIDLKIKKEVNCDEDYIDPDGDVDVNDSGYDLDNSNKKDRISSIFLELNVVKKENIYLKEQLDKYKKLINDIEKSYINLEIKEKNCNCICDCNNVKDNNDIVNKILLGRNVKNIILEDKQHDCVKEYNDEDDEEE